MSRTQRGFGLIDVIVGVSLLLVLFLALFGVLRASLLVSSLGRAKAGATAIAETQMEYLRGLSYGVIGTIGGIPSGSVPEEATTTENGVIYATHMFISYVDDPADGTGSTDTNGITTDYKRARVNVSYDIGGQSRSVTLVSNFAPPGLETTTGGGTLLIKIVNALGTSVADAVVTITDNVLSPAVNLSTFSNIDGLVSLPGAATSTSYQVSVTKNGYSSAQTYARDVQNQNPNPGYLTVSADQTTTGTFAIDLLSTLSLATFSPLASSTFADTFADTTRLASMSSTTIGSGTLTLTSGAPQGNALSMTTSPNYLSRWGSLGATTTVPSDASVLLHIYDASGTLIPDTALAGNAAGFTSFPVSLETVSTTTYPALAIGGALSASTTAPSVSGWSLSYTAGPIPLPNVAFTLTGAKTIGSTGSGAPLYKTIVNGSTNANGVTTLPLEWDQYTPTITGYDITDVCPTSPFTLAPGTTTVASLILTPATINSLRVLVSDATGVAVSGATITLSRIGYSNTLSSTACGNAYFGSIASASDYTLTIAKPGYMTTSFTNLSVSGTSTYSASFP